MIEETRYSNCLATPEQWAEWLRAPLEHAAGTGNRDLVDKLLGAGLRRAGAGGDMKAKTLDTGHTPLDLAVVGGNEAAAEALIMAGADMNVLDVKNDGLLHLTITGGHAGSNGNFPIHLPACYGFDEVALVLVQKRVDLNCVNIERRTPLYVAVRENHVSTVKVLLAEGADPNSLNLLLMATRENKAASIRALLEAGADIERRTSRESTPLHATAAFGSCAAMLTLLQLGANVNSKENRGKPRPKGKAAISVVIRCMAETRAASLPRLEHVSELLVPAPQDRAWRRRGFVVLRRALPNRVRLAVEIPARAAEATEQPQQRPRSRARTGQMKVEVEVDGTHRGGGRAGERNGARAGIEVVREGTVGGFDGVSAWMTALAEEEVFRRIVGFL
ncbi:unnamed protein product [Ectocarpus sp. CCAP 1310/34]|nr:unnamed protein product [Ectocarpus sp. CCAP 1310/34]